jgi:hypothetical protein
MKEKIKEKTKNIKKNFKKKTKALALAGILTVSTLTNNNCSSLIKNTLNSFEDGKEMINFVKKVYSKENPGSFKIILSEDFYKKINSEKIDRLLLFVHGFGSSYKKFGDEKEENSPLNLANKIYNGNVMLFDYSSNKKIPEIAKELISELEKISLNFKNEFPKIDVVAHSMGGDVIRYAVRMKPEYFQVVNFIASPLSGINFGKFNKTLIKSYPEILELEKREISNNIEDLFVNSEMFKELNSKTDSLNVIYNFYVFISKKNNPLVPGKDDGLIPIYSAYPYEDIKNGNFENVKIGNVLFFEGDVNHSSSLYNPSIMESILYFSKNLDINNFFYNPNNLVKPEEIPKIKILKAPLAELEKRKK